MRWKTLWGKILRNIGEYQRKLQNIGEYKKKKYKKARNIGDRGNTGGAGGLYFLQANVTVMA